MKKLAELKQGETAVIQDILDIPEHPGHHHGAHQGVATRLESMGLRNGKKIEMLTNQGVGPLLLKVDESRIALGRGLAAKVMVSSENNSFGSPK